MCVIGLGQNLEDPSVFIYILQVAIEDKLDGERLIVHKKGDKIELYSRKGTDYTETYKNIQEHIRKATGKSTECILDGEVPNSTPESNGMPVYDPLLL